ncbi:MAG: 50S ribosomal protein L20 [Planctomycetes bacterium]|nr:50S ribosomal protein L20 [Planctomycetota bacterium]
MPRVRHGAARRRHVKRTLQRAKGYRAGRRRLYKTAKEAVARAGKYGFAGRKLKKRDYRAMWIIRINAALEPLGISYSRFMNGLRKANIQLNRKALAELALSEPKALADLVEKAKQALAAVPAAAAK